jgi:hypothetical protein
MHAEPAVMILAVSPGRQASGAVCETRPVRRKIDLGSERLGGPPP